MKKPRNKGVLVKKVSAYPFSTNIVFEGLQPIAAQIVRITQEGALVDIGSAFVKIGTLGSMTFKLPTFPREIQLQGKVLKSQDRANTTKTTFTTDSIAAKKVGAKQGTQAGPQGQTSGLLAAAPKVQITRILEVRFLILSDAVRREISHFLAIIKQA